jgi:hypothetical protein
MTSVTGLRADSLLIFDLGFTNFEVFAQLTQAKVTFITRAKSNLAYQMERSLLRSAAVHDELVLILSLFLPLTLSAMAFSNGNANATNHRYY